MTTPGESQSFGIDQSRLPIGIDFSRVDTRSDIPHQYSAALDDLIKSTVIHLPLDSLRGVDRMQAYQDGAHNCGSFAVGLLNEGDPVAHGSIEQALINNMLSGAEPAPSGDIPEITVTFQTPENDL